MAFLRDMHVLEGMSVSMGGRTLGLIAEANRLFVVISTPEIYGPCAATRTVTRRVFVRAFRLGVLRVPTLTLAPEILG